MYAIFETGGKQYKAEKGTVLFVEKLDAAENDVITFDKVLCFSDGKDAKVGTPYLSSILVAGKVLKQGKEKKITVFTYKPKKNEKRKLGHRQPYTKIEVVGIGTEAEVKKDADAAKKTDSTAKKTVKATDDKEEKKPVAKKTAAKTTTAKKSTATKTTKAADDKAEKKPAAKKTTATKTTTAKKSTTTKTTAAKKTTTAKKSTTTKTTTAKKAESKDAE